MRHLKWIIPLVVMLSLVFAPVALAAPAPQLPACGYWYTVRWGDTLSSIGRASGVSPWAIAQANRLPNPNYISPGQVLWIPCAPAPSCGYWYAVRWGDTLNSIARRTGVSSWAIAQANRIYDVNRIYAGQSLWIPCP